MPCVDVRGTSSDGGVAGVDAGLAEEADGVGSRTELGPGSSSLPLLVLLRSRLNAPASRCCSMSEAEPGCGRSTPKAQINDCVVSLFLAMSNARMGVASDD